jgi:hypothetical protein
VTRHALTIVVGVAQIVGEVRVQSLSYGGAVGALSAKERSPSNEPVDLRLAQRDRHASKP